MLKVYVSQLKLVISCAFSPDKRSKWTRREVPYLLHPPPPSDLTLSRKLGGTARGGVQECAGSLLPKNRSGLLGSNLLHTLAKRHTQTPNARKDRLCEGGESAQPPSRMSTDCCAFGTHSDSSSFSGYDIFTNNPHSFHTTFTCPERL